LLNIFEVFLPQLLLYPNPNDPLNGSAAALYLRDKETYKSTVKAHIQKHALPSSIVLDEDGEGYTNGKADEEEELSDLDDGMEAGTSASIGDDLVFD